MRRNFNVGDLVVDDRWNTDGVGIVVGRADYWDLKKPRGGAWRRMSYLGRNINRLPSRAAIWLLRRGNYRVLWPALGKIKAGLISSRLEHYRGDE